MNREIKFRAWDGKEMSYRDLGAFVSIDEMTITPVRCELMQFTGLKDSQGKEIYEGDIVTFGTGKGVVEYRKDRNISYGHSDCDESFSIGFHLGSSYGENNVLEVIGNIYEDKGLLD